jgi:hypothetical protein
VEQGKIELELNLQVGSYRVLLSSSICRLVHICRLVPIEYWCPHPFISWLLFIGCITCVIFSTNVVSY